MAKDKRRGKRKKTMAERADRHKLYEKSVQSVDVEVEFLDKTFRSLRRRTPRLLREDFCGTANAASQWVRSNRLHRSIGVDLDPEVLEWGRARHVEALPPGARRRIELINGDVREVQTEPADILVAFNFSYWVFETRDNLRHYMARARANLTDDGLMFLDAFGGAEALTECEEETEYKRFTYVWDQAEYDPVTGHFVCHIHFRFPDGSKLEPAFSYQWRLWTMPEIRELLAEAGFRKSTVYWEGEDEDGEGNGEYEPVEHGQNDPAWVAYIVAEK